MSKVTLGQILGNDNVDAFEDFDMTEVQKVLKNLAVEEGFDIAHVEWLQQRCLYGVEILIDMSAKMVKTVSFLESRINSVKNKVALEYKHPDEKVRLTAEMRKAAAESSEEVEQLGILLARSKGAKLAVEKKMDLLLKSHYHFKELAANQKQGIISGSSKATGHEKDSQSYGKVNW